MIDAVSIADEGVAKPGEVDQAMPVGVVAGETRYLKLELDSSFTFQDFNTSNSKHLPAGCLVYFLQCGATSWPIIGRHLSESAIQGLLILCWSWHQCGVTVGRRMFFRIKPSGERRYLQIVENTCDGAATRQRVVATLGRVEDLEASGKLDALLRSGARLCETALLISSLQAGTLEASATARIGAPMVFDRLWEQTGCAAVIEHLAADRGFGFSLERAVFASVLHRLVVSG